MLVFEINESLSRFPFCVGLTIHVLFTGHASTTSTRDINPNDVSGSVYSSILQTHTGTMLHDETDLATSIVFPSMAYDAFNDRSIMILSSLLRTRRADGKLGMRSRKSLHASSRRHTARVVWLRPCRASQLRRGRSWCRCVYGFWRIVQHGQVGDAMRHRSKKHCCSAQQ